MFAFFFIVKTLKYKISQNAYVNKKAKLVCKCVLIQISTNIFNSQTSKIEILFHTFHQSRINIFS